MKLLRYGLGLLLFLFLVPGPLYAEISSWVDENGVRRYSDSPPDNPDGPVEVIKEIENKEPPQAALPESGSWKEEMEQKKADEETADNEKMLKKQKADREERIKSAYEALIRLKDIVTGKFEWDEYARLLADAKPKVDALAGIPEIKDVSKLLAEAFESYEIVPELKRMEMVGQRASLVKRIRQMNEEWGTAVPENYYKAREICWQRAADRLSKTGISP